MFTVRLTAAARVRCVHLINADSMPSGCQPQTKTNELTLNLPIGCYQLHLHSQMIQQVRLLK